LGLHLGSLGPQRNLRVATLVTALGVGGMIAMTVDAPLWLVYLAILLYGIGHSAGNPPMAPSSVIFSPAAKSA